MKKLLLVALFVSGLIASSVSFARCCPGDCCAFKSYKTADTFIKQLKGEKYSKASYAIVKQGDFIRIKVNKKA